MPEVRMIRLKVQQNPDQPFETQGTSNGDTMELDSVSHLPCSSSAEDEHSTQANSLPYVFPKRLTHYPDLRIRRHGRWLLVSEILHTCLESRRRQRTKGALGIEPAECILSLHPFRFRIQNSPP